MPSPEALQAATVWLRDTTFDGLLAEFEDIQHPLGETIRANVDPSRRQLRLFAEYYIWASYVHWGRPCRLQ